MSAHIDRRLTSGFLVVCAGALAPHIAEALLAHRLSLEGMPVVYGTLGISLVAAAAAAWYASAYSLKYVLLYSAVAVGTAGLMFGYLFMQTSA
ncbi:MULTISPECIES: hypothetical protein [unclassified Haloferax]|uniref:hypothetical protein n=1 Tax=unclassified Haloferax TaxID=2625095 RepID=UPI000737AF6C|nr:MULTISPECIES: hypothetical protein [unclassified Haloferax]MCO8268680.1 hypothetical protein [Haloferax sp. AB510]